MKKVKDACRLTTEGRLMSDLGMANAPAWDMSLTVVLCGLRGEMYGERLEELQRAWKGCVGRGFTCKYGEVVFKFPHLHMAGAAEKELEARYKAFEEEEARNKTQMVEGEDVWIRKPVSIGISTYDLGATPPENARSRYRTTRVPPKGNRVIFDES